MRRPVVLLGEMEGPALDRKAERCQETADSLFGRQDPLGGDGFGGRGDDFTEKSRAHVVESGLKLNPVPIGSDLRRLVTIFQLIELSQLRHYHPTVALRTGLVATVT